MLDIYDYHEIWHNFAVVRHNIRQNLSRDLQTASNTLTTFIVSGCEADINDGPF